MRQNVIKSLTEQKENGKFRKVTRGGSSSTGSRFPTPMEKPESRDISTTWVLWAKREDISTHRILYSLSLTSSSGCPPCTNSAPPFWSKTGFRLSYFTSKKKKRETCRCVVRFSQRRTGTTYLKHGTVFHLSPRIHLLQACVRKE